MNAKGCTGWDVLILLTTVALLMGLVFVASGPSYSARAKRTQCCYNLKAIALCLRTWANDHEEQFPMTVSSAKGGAREAALSGDPVPIFVIASNEIVSPKVLLCPADKERPSRAPAFEGLSAKNVSYLIGIDASETNAYSILV